LPAAAQFDRLCVVLVATRNPLNLGAAARAMSNFGFARLRVVNPFPVAFRDARSAVGASKVLAAAEEYRTVAEAVADCTLVVGTTAVGRRALQHPLRRLEHGVRLIRKRMASGRVALLFGSEKRGLSNADFSHCHWLLHIPTSKDNISMNLGQAVAVCLYELARDARVPRAAETPVLASAGEVERMTQMLFEALYASGFLIRKPTSDAEERVRRLVRRLQLRAQDMPSWLGILRQIVWKLRSDDKAGERPV
jgi:TrmH family RNA methyltransferase